jgi:hypothetical protein
MYRCAIRNIHTGAISFYVGTIREIRAMLDYNLGTFAVEPDPYNPDLS